FRLRAGETARARRLSWQSAGNRPQVRQPAPVAVRTVGEFSARDIAAHRHVLHAVGRSSRMLRPDRRPRQEAAMSQAQTPTRSRRRFVRFVAVLPLLALGVFFAPAVVAHTPLRAWAVARAVGPLNGTITVGSASFGWFRGPELRDVELRDPAGERL